MLRKLRTRTLCATAAWRLAAYAGLVPVASCARVTRCPEWYCYAFNAFYDRKRKEGKRHTQALIALARRRVDIVIEIPPYLYFGLDIRLIHR